MKLKKMEKSKFEEHRLEWLKEWYSTYRLLDIDFETYMVMQGVSPDEYKRLNEMIDGEPSGDDCSISF
jgi:hypothetical protein